MNYYTYGNFTYGDGTYGYGPALPDQDEEMIVKYNTNQVMYTSLTEYGDVVLRSTPTIVSGDVKISKDGSIFTDLINLPTVNGTQVVVTLTSAETQAKLIEVLFKDQTNPPEWNDKSIIYDTYGNVDAYVAFDYTNNVSAINNVPVDFTPITNILNNNVYGLSAINDNVLGTSAAIGSIVIPVTDLTPVTSGVDYLISQIDNTSYGLSAINDNITSIPNNILTMNIDGLTFEDSLTKILSYAIGKIAYEGSGEFVYYKQDNVTSAFSLSGTDSFRTRA